MLSYEIKRYQTEGATDKQIVLNPSEAQKKEIKNVSELLNILMNDVHV